MHTTGQVIALGEWEGVEFVQRTIEHTHIYTPAHTGERVL